MKNKFFKDVLYYIIFVYILSFIFNFLTLKNFPEAIKSTLYQSIEIILGSLLISYILYIRRITRNKK